MVQFRNLLKRFIPLILALVVVISLFPAVPASAASTNSKSYIVLGRRYSLSSGAWSTLDDCAALIFPVKFSSKVTSSAPVTLVLNNASRHAYYSGCYWGESIDAFPAQCVLTPIDGSPSFLSCYNIPAGEGFLVLFLRTSTSDGSDLANVSFTFNGETYFPEVRSDLPSYEEPEVSYNYFVDIDGSSFMYSSIAESITLDLIITADDYKISVDGSEEDYRISDTVLNNDKQKFAGLSINGYESDVDYPIGTYSITLTADDPMLQLGSVFKYPLYIDPNGGTWNGSAAESVFWDFPTADTDNIVDPVRENYQFDGWTFTGTGSFWDDEYPYSYTHNEGAGHLTANWTYIGSSDPDPVPDPEPGSYTHTVIIGNESFVFTGSTGAPYVTIDVTATGAVLSSGDISYTWTYSGDALFDSLWIIDQSYVVPIGSSESLMPSPGSDKISNITVIALPIEPDPDPVIYTHTVIIGGESFVFSSSTGAPPVTIDVRDDYVVLYSGDDGLVWNFSGSGSFGGIRDSSGNLYEPSAWFSVMGANGSNKTTTFTVELGGHGDDLPDPTQSFTSTVNVYDLTGSTLLFTWSESGSGSCPSFRLVTSNIGLSISGAASNDSWLYSGSGSIAGFSLSPVSTTLALRSGSSFSSGGYSGQDYVLNLYLVRQEDLPSSPSGSGEESVAQIFSGIANFLIMPLMAFFNVQFIPGFSFGGLAVIAFLFGLLFWFLKSSK